MLPKAEILQNVRRVFMENPDFAKVCYDTVKNLRDGIYNADGIQDAIFQNSWHHPIDETDAFHFIRIWKGIMTGKILLAKIDIGVCPSEDKAKEENNLKLSRVPNPFLAEFNPSSGAAIYDDGYLSWDKPVVFEYITLNSKNKQVVNKEVAEPRTLPLEVGTTSSYTTFMHLIVNGGVARWPYDSNVIHLFVSRGFRELDI